LRQVSDLPVAMGQLAGRQSAMALSAL